MPTSFYITGNRGISSFMPGNFTGNPSVGGAVVGSSGVGLTIKVGSGADQDGGPVSMAASSRTNPASNGATAPIMAYIGSVSSGSGSIDQLAGQRSGDSVADGSRAVVAPHGGCDPRFAGRDVSGRGHADEPAVRRRDCSGASARA